ncbi:MAG: hypothetical protein IPN01_29480 [Deltaproteobacteria bacterium]|nr:hypothetical protein [Deltaproteobacteria bacterium]
MDLFGQILSGVAAAHMAGGAAPRSQARNVLLAADGDAVIAKVSRLRHRQARQRRPRSRPPKAARPWARRATAPEQITDSAIADQRSDVMSALGAILYEDAQRPARLPAAPTCAELLENTLTGRYHPLRRLNPKGGRCPDGGHRPGDDGLPDDRFQNCMEWRALHIRSDRAAQGPCPPGG